MTGTIAGSLAGGLVGANEASAVISQSWANISVSQTFEVAEQGGLAGDNAGLIVQSYVTGQVSGGLAIGGLAGGNSGKIEQTYSMASVTGLSHLSNNSAGSGQDADIQALAVFYALVAVWTARASSRSRARVRPRREVSSEMLRQVIELMR